MVGVNTLYVNLYGGPGTGKSTTAALTFGRLKVNGTNAELVQEYAKDRVWQEDWAALRFQPYIQGKQMFRQYRLLGKVEVAVTDSPILLSALYAGFGCVEGWELVLFHQYQLFNNLNVFLVRNSEAHPYNSKGRSQSEEQAIAIDVQTKELLDRFGVAYHEVAIKENGSHVEDILSLVEEHRQASLPA